MNKVITYETKRDRYGQGVAEKMTQPHHKLKNGHPWSIKGRHFHKKT
jgi:hypothetical protein